MSTHYQIVIKNMSAQTMSFYAFQKQAVFNAGGLPTILSSSLASGPLASNARSGAQLDFAFDTQNYVGARNNIPTSNSGMFDAAISLRSVMLATSQAEAAIQPIDLATGSGQSVGNCSTLAVSPLGLSAPAYQAAVPAGSFGIQIPAYVPASFPELYCGCAAINQDGTITLSSYVTPPPNSQVYCAPVPCFYVKVGDSPAGQIISYDTSQSALCDFTSGFSTINVQYNSDGTFSVTPSS